jgi:hypothetical protein
MSSLAAQKNIATVICHSSGREMEMKVVLRISKVVLGHLDDRQRATNESYSLDQ